ncbi:site-specific integrase [Bradyrhizobium septentrionale]|uniref:Tyrosine-type recombinase/integrase n=1 Tax=Bradyrhizobium septentrionale TaxID=1404411 RepID=A0ABZ2NPJ1_9BRAD
MTLQVALLEPSFADAIAAIDRADDLSVSRKSHWRCSLGKIGEWLDRPLETIPARWTAVVLSVGQLHHAPLDVTAKTLANHRANAAAVLRWFAKESNVSPRGVLLLPAWAALRDGIDHYGRKARLSGFFRYCSGMGISPDAVGDETLADYFRYRAATTSLETSVAARRSVAREWNVSAGLDPAWPTQRLTEPPLSEASGLAWSDFPNGLREDIEDYLVSLSKIRRSPTGRRSRPCSPRTIKTCRAELVAVIKKAVGAGIQLENLTSLASLVHPDVVEPVIEAYWREDGDEPNVFTIDVGQKLMRLGRLSGLESTAIDRLEEIAARLEEYRHGGMTEKNLSLIRKVTAPGVWRRVTDLPAALMIEARHTNAHAPVKAALTAQIAAAIAILTYAPVRLANLAAIELERNLIKPGGPASPFWLTFPRFDVKNRVDLNFQLDADVSLLIDEYIHDFRPALLRGANANWLFPGTAGQPKTANMFSGQITDRIESATGLRVTAHQFRHASAAIYLKHYPGEYETVRRFLGHRNIQTTINFYCGLETTHANARYASTLRQHVTFDAENV